MDRDSYAICAQLTWWVSVASQYALFAHLWRFRLLACYPFFSLWVGASAALSTALILLGTHHPAYRLLWGMSAFIGSGLLAGAAFETLRKMRREYPNTGPMHLRLKIFVTVTLLVFAFALFEDSQRWAWGDVTTATMCAGLAVRRLGNITAAAVVALAWFGCYRWVRDMLAPNTRRHAMLTVIYCGCTGILYYLIPLNIISRRAINLALSAVPMILYWVWVRSLTVAGEARMSFFDGEEAETSRARVRNFLNWLRTTESEIRHRARR